MKWFHKWSDDALIEAIRGNVKDRERALKYFFGHRTLQKSVENHILYYGGSHEDFEDIWQETMIIFDRSIRNGKFLGKSKLTTYFIGIAKICWLKRRKNLFQSVEYDVDAHDSIEFETYSESFDPQLIDYLKSIISYLSERCQKLLLIDLNNEYSYKELEQQGELGSADAIRKDTSRCRQRLYALFEEQPRLREFLKPFFEK